MLRSENKPNSKPSESAEPKDVSFNSSSENVEWDRVSYERKKESNAKQKVKFSANFLTSDGVDASLYKKCRKRAENYVQQAIAEQDAEFEAQDNVGIRNFVRKVDRETFIRSKATKNPQTSRGKCELPKSREPTKLKNEEKEQHSARKGSKSKETTPRDQSDTELSQVTQSSSEESKTFSQIYSEIFEESRARQEKAEQIYRVYTKKNSNQREDSNRSKSKERTTRWVENLGELDGNSTEGSNESDKESEPSMNENCFTEEDYKYLIREQLEVISRYKEELHNGYENYIEDYLSGREESETDEEEEGMKSISSSSDTKESLSEKEAENSDNKKESSKLNENENDKLNVLQFEHCEIYVSSKKDLKKSPTESKELKQTIDDSKPTDSNSSIRDKAKLKDNVSFGSSKSISQVAENSEQAEGNSSRSYPSPTEEQRNTDEKSVQSEELSYKSSHRSSKRDEEQSYSESEENVKNELNTRGSFEDTEERTSSNVNSSQSRDFINKASTGSSKHEEEHSSWDTEANDANGSKSSLEPVEDKISQRSTEGKSKSNSSKRSFKRDKERNSWNSPAEKQNSQRITFKENTHPSKDSKSHSAYSIKRDEKNNSPESSFMESSEFEKQSSKNSTNKTNSEDGKQAKSFVKPVKERFLQKLETKAVPDNCEQSETDRSKSIEERKSSGSSYRLNKSERASSNSHKSRSKRSTRNMDIRPINICLQYGDGDGRDNNSDNSSIISNTQSVKKHFKSYQDRASSPIQIIYSERSDNFELELEMRPKTEEMEDEIVEEEVEEVEACYIEVSASATSTKISSVSEEKGVQYPSGDELERSSRSKKTALKVYDVDEALLKVPINFKGNAIVFDHESSLLDISLTDDEMQMQAKLQAAAWSARKKKKSSSNHSSVQSLPTGNSRNSSSTMNSSTFSIRSYVPSVRFQRRTQPEKEADLNLQDDEKDTLPTTYEKHVARLAEHALRACTNYYQDGVQMKPELEQNKAAKDQMLYNSETLFNTKQEDLLLQFNQRLQRQLKLITPRFQ